MPAASDKRNRLLTAAEAIVRRDGYSALNLNAVAARAGVSKGGLLYHFPSKEALVAGLIEALTEDFEQAHAAKLAADTAGPGAWTRAYVRTTVSAEATAADEASAALVAAISHDPRLLDSLRERYRTWEGDLDADGLPGVDAHITRLAADGLWAADLFGLASPTGELRRRIVARLLELAGAPDAP